MVDADLLPGLRIDQIDEILKVRLGGRDVSGIECGLGGVQLRQQRVFWLAAIWPAATASSISWMSPPIVASTLKVIVLADTLPSASVAVIVIVWAPALSRPASMLAPFAIECPSRVALDDATPLTSLVL